MSKAAVGVSYSAPSAASPLVFKPKSAWAKGPPRSLSNRSDAPTTPLISNSSPVAVADGLPDPETRSQPFSPMSPDSTSTPTLTAIVPPLSTDIPNASSPTEIRDEDTTAPITNENMVSSSPPPRPKRNPLRRESSAGSPSEPIPTPNQLAPSSESSSASTPTQTLTSSATSQNSSTAPTSWSSFLAQTKTIPPITTDLPPVSKEPRTRSRSRRRDQADDASMSIPLTLPPLPSYPPPLPPGPPSSAAPAKSKLQVDAQPFVPTLLTPTSSCPTPVSSRRTAAAIIIKRPDGEEIDIRKLSTLVTLSASPSAGTGPAVFSVSVPTNVRLESEEERKKRLAAESAPATGEEPATELMVVSPSTTHESIGFMRHPSSHEDNNQNHDSAIDEEDEGRSAQTLNIPVLSASPPTAPLDSDFPMTPPSSGLTPTTPNPNTLPLTRPRRERSRRGSKRGDSANRNSAVMAAGLEVGASGPMIPTTGLSAMTRTRSGGLTRTRPDAGEMMSRTRSSTGETRTRAVTGEAMMRTRSGEGMTRTISNEPRRRPGRLDLSGLTKAADTGAMAYPFASAKAITDLNAIVYPEGVAPPNKELNEGVEDGKFRYDRDFVLQFRDYCMERPLRMEEHEVITPAQPIEQSVPTATRTRRRRSVRSNAEPVVPTPILTGSTLVVPVTASLPSASLTAEEQLLVGTISASPSSATSGPLSPGMGRTGSRGGRSRNGSNAAKMGGLNATTSTVTSLHPFPMMRSKSHGSSRPNALGSAHPPPPLERRSGSQKAQKRSASIRNDPPLPFSSLAPGLTEEYKPLETSANRWTPSSLGVIKPVHSAPDATVESEEVVEKRLKGLLNKLTLEKFDSISDQIVSWANKSERETDGATLRLVIRLVFDKATDEAAWSAMYARLCRKMMEQVSTEVRDENIHDRKGEPIVGGQLFRQYLLSRCQADFERGWSTRETLEEQQSAAAAAAAQESAPGEMVFSDEYYALQKAKRRGLGLVKFIGELFKLGMLTERIMHRCILKLLDEPAEDDIESVCQLLKTVGAALSRSKGKESMDMYFERMRELSESANISQRIRFMLLDVMDLRAKGWISKNQSVGPSTLAQIHEAAAKEANEKSATSKPIPIVRNGSRRGQNRSETGSQKDSDAWMSMGSSARSFGRTSGMLGSLITGQSKIDDSLKSIGAIKSASSSLSGFHSLARLSSEPGTSRMSRQPSEPGKSRSKRGGGGESRQVNRRTSIDFVHLDAVVDSGNTGRKRLHLLPRSVAPPAVPSSIDDNNPVEPTSSLAATFEEPPSMTEEQARIKVEEDLKEFMQIRDLDEAVGYFESLPSDMRYLLVDKFVTKMDSKESDVVLICELFERVASSGLCSMEVFEQGFAPTIEALDDISLDVPSAYAVMARLLRASKLPREVVDRLSGTINIYETVLVHPRDKLIKEFDGTA